MDRPLSIVVLAGLLLVGVGITALHLQMRIVTRTQEAIVADFTGLTGDIADIKSTLTDLASRAEAAFAAATDAEADQGQVDAAKAQLDDVLAEMRAIGNPPATAPTDTTPTA